MGRTAATYIPDRLTEGYGPTPASMAALAEEGATLIITVDCGTAAGPAIEAANKHGADVIVVDHHQADEMLPPAFAVLNPNRQDDLSGQGHLAAAGVVFLFLVATARALRSSGAYAQAAEPDLLGLLDLVALATVCDVVPLKGVNRALVAKGLKVLRHRHNAGLRALADVARIDAAPTCYTLGYILGPRINAGGRVGASGLGAKLLATDDESEARAIAAKLEALNTERKAIEERMLAEAFALCRTRARRRAGRLSGSPPMAGIRACSASSPGASPSASLSPLSSPPGSLTERAPARRARSRPSILAAWCETPCRMDS